MAQEATLPFNNETHFKPLAPARLTSQTTPVKPLAIAQSRENFILEKISQLLDMVAENNADDFKNELGSLSQNGDLFNEVWARGKSTILLHAAKFNATDILSDILYLEPEIVNGPDTIETIMESAAIHNSISFLKQLLNSSEVQLSPVYYPNGQNDDGRHKIASIISSAIDEHSTEAVIYLLNESGFDPLLLVDKINGHTYIAKFIAQAIIRDYSDLVLSLLESNHSQILMEELAEENSRNVDEQIKICWRDAASLASASDADDTLAMILPRLEVNNLSIDKDGLHDLNESLIIKAIAEALEDGTISSFNLLADYGFQMHSNYDSALNFLDKILHIIDEYENVDLLTIISNKFLDIWGDDSIEDLMLAAVRCDSVYIMDWLTNNLYDLTEPAMKENHHLVITNLASAYGSENVLYKVIDVLKSNPDSMKSLSNLALDYILGNAVNEDNLDDFNMIYSLKYNKLEEMSNEYGAEEPDFEVLLTDLLSSLSLKAAGANAVQVFTRLNELRADAREVDSPEYFQAVFDAASHSNSIGIVKILEHAKELEEVAHTKESADDSTVSIIFDVSAIIAKRRSSGDTENGDSGLDDSSSVSSSPVDSQLLGCSGFFIDSPIAV